MWDDEIEERVDRFVFEECKAGHPDDHWLLDPLCRSTTFHPDTMGRHEDGTCGQPQSAFEHNEHGDPLDPRKHLFIPPTEPLVWGENAWRTNVCHAYVDHEWVDGQWTALERPKQCTCRCHQGTYYVNVYRLDQGYGGPEEGGWYYECGEPVASVPFDTLREAEAEQEKLSVRFPAGRNRYSVAPRGEDFGVYIERHFAAPFPEHTPRYE